VLGRAIVRDSAAAGQAALRMCLLIMVQSLAPGIGPMIGGERNPYRVQAI
jgi:hypothetical protein